MTKEQKVETADEIGGLAEEGSLLFVGVDDRGSADAIFTYEMSQEGKATIYSIPRDTFIADGQRISTLLAEENGDEKDDSDGFGNHGKTCKGLCTDGFDGSGGSHRRFGRRHLYGVPRYGL